MSKKSNLFKTLPAIILSTLLVVIIIYAWTEPGSAPPAGNVPAPINVGDSAQIKSGPLQVNGFRNIGSTIFDGNVGIGTTNPGAELDVAGAIKFGDTASVCDATNRGAMKFVAGGADSIYVCMMGSNGIYSWKLIAGGVVDMDGNIYDTVFIGTQIWMKQNLRTGTMIAGTANPSNNNIIEKYCYDDNGANCATDGGLYQWDEAMRYSASEGDQGICPSSWHIPRDSEWYTLENYLKYGATSCVSTRDGLWDCYGAGVELRPAGSSGFYDLNVVGFAGYRRPNSSFHDLGRMGFFWSSSASGTNAWDRLLDISGPSGASVYRDAEDKANGFSVRCIKD